jgi:hypothetical protein
MLRLPLPRASRDSALGACQLVVPGFCATAFHYVCKYPSPLFGRIVFFVRSLIIGHCAPFQIVGQSKIVTPTVAFQVAFPKPFKEVLFALAVIDEFVKL